MTGRPRLPGHLVAKLTCAGTVQPVWQRAGVPVSVGRALRIVPERTRRLVLDRDRGCRFPGCVARAHLEVHHVVHWVDGGRTDLANLVAVCPFHHDAHHRGEFSITGDANVPGGLVFLARGGFPIGPGPIYAPGTTRGAGGRPAGSGSASGPWSAGQAWTIGVSTDAPGRPGPVQTSWNNLEDLGSPTRPPTPRAWTPTRTNRPGCRPGSDRRWRTRARPGRRCSASGSPSTKAHPCRCDAGGRHSRDASGRAPPLARHCGTHPVHGHGWASAAYGSGHDRWVVPGAGPGARDGQATSAYEGP